MGKEMEEASPPHVGIEISSSSAGSKRKILHRVPPQVRENKKHIYDPVVLSIGPYHHGRSNFRQTEHLKEEILNIILLNSNVRGSFLSKILERIDEIRHFYDGLSTDEFGDDELAQMMLYDTCSVLYYIVMLTNYDSNINSHFLVSRLGLFVVTFMMRDYCMLENQIPFWIIRLLIDLTIHDEDEGEALLCTFLSCTNFGDDDRLTRVPWKDDNKEPLHLVEAHRITLVKDEIVADSNNRHRSFKFKWGHRKRSSCTLSSSYFAIASSAFRSVTDLKAKGIHFRPSSNCLRDIKFNSYSFYGELYLPIWFVTNNSPVFLSNTVAFEMTPEADTDFAVLSYISFMKSLIENPKDVQELREKGILFSCLANDEEVVKMFKEIDTYGLDVSLTSLRENGD